MKFWTYPIFINKNGKAWLRFVAALDKNNKKEALNSGKK